MSKATVLQRHADNIDFAQRYSNKNLLDGVFLIWLTVRLQSQITMLWVLAIVFIFLSHPSFEKGHSLVKLIAVSQNSCWLALMRVFLHLYVDQYKIKVPFGPICHPLALHSAASNYCNSWTFKKILNPKGVNIRCLFFNSDSSGKVSLIYRNSRLPAKVHRAGETSAFPFVLFSPGGILQQAESRRWKTALGPIQA